MIKTSRKVVEYSTNRLKMLKIKFGSALPEYTKENEVINIQVFKGRETSGDTSDQLSAHYPLPYGGNH